MEKKKVFVIMPFQDEFFEVYEMLKMKFADRFEFSNAGDEANQQNILKDIIQPIFEADIIIADLTGLNANVMYELGLAHAFNKKTIVITKDELSKLPFDLKQYRAKDYDTHFKKFAELLEYLSINLNGAVDNTVLYSNPVKDFLTLEKIEDFNWFKEKHDIVLQDDSDKGFLDFLAEIEESTMSLTETIQEMNKDMNEMNSGVSASTAEIDRVKNTGGSSAAFVRKQSKKVATYIETFTTKLRDKTSVMSNLWNEIEKNALGLLENRFASNDDNRDHLINYLKALYGMKQSIVNSNLSMEGLKDSMNNIMGMERSLNQAIRFVVADISSYIDVMEQIKSSVEKILAKSKFIVGDIDYDSIALDE